MEPVAEDPHLGSSPTVQAPFIMYYAMHIETTEGHLISLASSSLKSDKKIQCSSLSKLQGHYQTQIKNSAR